MTGSRHAPLPLGAFFLIILGGLFEIMGIAAVVFGYSFWFLLLVLVGGAISIVGIKRLINRPKAASEGR